MKESKRGGGSVKRRKETNKHRTKEKKMDKINELSVIIFAIKD